MIGPRSASAAYSPSLSPITTVAACMADAEVGHEPTDQLVQLVFVDRHRVISSLSWFARRLRTIMRRPIAPDVNMMRRRSCRRPCRRLAARTASRWQGPCGSVSEVMSATMRRVPKWPRSESRGPVERYLTSDRGCGDGRLRRAQPGRDARRHRAELAFHGRAGTSPCAPSSAAGTPIPAVSRSWPARHCRTGSWSSSRLRWEEGGVPHAVHQAHVVEVDDDRITRDQVWCGGRWPAPLLAEMAEAASATA